jgi:hypothetical protein
MLKFFLKFVFVAGMLGFIMVVLTAALVLEPTPRVTDASPPEPEDVAAARSFVRGVRAALDAENGGSSSFDTTLRNLNATMKLGARFVPGFRGVMEVDGDHITGHASVPVRLGQATQWINLTLTAPEFEGTFVLSRAQLGGFDLSPDFALAALRIGANRIFGNDMGDTVVSAAQRMKIDGTDLSFTLTLGEMGGNGIMRGVFGTLRGEEMPGSDEIKRYYLLIREEMERGGLPTTGSYLPYLHFTLAAAEEGAAQEGPANAYTSALFALTLICGAKDFTLVVGGLVTGDLDDGQTWTKSCEDVTLNDRIDSRRHFTTAAAIQAASNRGFAVSVGEFKELNDTLNAGGFDFTDISANNSGIRMSNRFMGAPVSEWATLRDRIATENDVIIPFDGIPQIMEEADFRARFGDIDSDAYKAQLAQIEARIDTLALHR